MPDDMMVIGYDANGNPILAPSNNAPANAPMDPGEDPLPPLEGMMDFEAGMDTMNGLPPAVADDVAMQPEVRRAEPAPSKPASGSQMDLSFIQRINDPSLTEDQARAEYEKLPAPLRYVYDRTADFSYNNQGSQTPAQLDPRDANRWLDEFYNMQSEQAKAQNDPRGQAIAKAQAQKQQAAMDTIGSMRSTINDLVSHPGFSGSVGAKNQAYLFGLKSEPIAGTKEADFKAMLDQVQGGAFLQAFESLKGGGQITQIEGEKATQAIVRAQQSQSEEGFKKSMNDFLSVLDKAEKRATSGEIVQQPATPGAPAARPMPQFTVGQRVTDRFGNVAVYRGMDAAGKPILDPVR